MGSPPSPRGRGGALEEVMAAFAACRRSTRARREPSGGREAGACRFRLTPWAGAGGRLVRFSGGSEDTATAEGRTHRAKVRRCAFQEDKKGSPTAESMRTDHFRCLLYGTPGQCWQLITLDSTHWESSESAATASSKFFVKKLRVSIPGGEKTAVVSLPQEEKSDRGLTEGHRGLAEVRVLLEPCV